ncbi:exonuclease domain-containing protein [Nonomuraea africana]|uniref:DNA polymerase-3 subunit epsilon n=1 Tax=Nonomuraea africana TaxID=46171 RepID=A0ABR9KP93_9ACTN|nr:exonuclease domain-containing protein [Nonomuraea africana]MBE1563595.1 DNA polymerase-3 subunit epsilon [Nonomuraea africana]
MLQSPEMHCINGKEMSFCSLAGRFSGGSVMFVHGQLTRNQGIDPRNLTFASIDLETTGLYPNKGSRVCEIGIVRMRGDGVVLDEYSTLVAPGIRIANDEYHGITNAVVKGAPTFQQIAGDVLAYLSNAIVVSHNLDYEDKFLTAEFGRLGINLRDIPGLCTLVMTRTQLDRYGYRLDDVANLITGEWPAASHSALGDARTLANMLARVITQAPQRLSWRGPTPVALPPYPRTGVIAPRAAGLRKGTEGWLASLTARLPLMAQPPAPQPQGVTDYQAMLGHALADGRIVGEEAQQLALLAARAGLTQLTARQVHESFLANVRARAEADGVVTTAELKELQRAARELAATHLIGDLEQAAAADRARRNGPLKGWRLLPVGDAPGVAEVMDFASTHGATVAANVTKTVRLVVADSPAGDDPRLQKATAAGITILSSGEAMQLLEKEVEMTHAGLFANARGQELAEKLSAEQRQQALRQRPEWHEAWRPRELSTADYRALFIDRYRDWDESRRTDHTTRVTLQPHSSASARQPHRAASKRTSGCAAALVVLASAAAVLTEAVRQLLA